jgi:hypothetical protein
LRLNGRGGVIGIRYVPRAAFARPACVRSLVAVLAGIGSLSFSTKPNIVLLDSRSWRLSR